jgi:hypothetical protein
MVGARIAEIMAVGAISGFESLQDAEHWIATEAQNWLNALNTQL